MSLLVVGSIAFDSVETPTDRRDNVIGGSATYFSYAASYFTPVKLVGVVGDDWPDGHTALLESRNINTEGLEVKEGEKTFSWKGKYLPNMNDRETLEVNLNVFETFSPVLPESYKDTPFVFLANGAPNIQLQVLDQINNPTLVVADTMDLWINIQKDEVLELIKRIDGLVLNDSEAKLLTGEENLVKAGQAVLALGAGFCVLKKGEHGAMYFGKDGCYVLPAFPTEQVLDPTGAGDSFAGGMMGYLASQNTTAPADIKRALVYGTIVASFNVEDFSLERMKQIEREALDQRFAQYQQMLAIS